MLRENPFIKAIYELGSRDKGFPISELCHR